MVSPAECTEFEASAAGLLLRAAALVPTAHYLAAVLVALAVFIYNFLEIHILNDFLHGFRGDPVVLTFDPASKIYEGVVSKCRILHGRYLVTPWLSSPHFQTVFLNFFGRPPTVVYRRQLYSVQDGGTVALDWLYASEVARGSSNTDSTVSKDLLSKSAISKDDTTPIIVVVPGLTSDSFSPYLRHTTYCMAKHGWNVVVSNHRGLGGISITSDCFYNAGWTEDLREIINYLHHEYPNAPLLAVGTSIGANILVKYLGEEGENTPIAGAASVCSPWDLVVGDRFITRKLTQRLYDKALAIGLKGYAQLHQPILARLANWEGISKSRSVRDFDNHATCHTAKFETVDTYYRRCSSVNFIGNVAVPLLCISALDDPVCTREAIPWDECRANKNIVLATTTHGGHLGFFKGLTASTLWWVGAVGEFLTVLHSSPFMHGQKKTPERSSFSLLQSDIDKGPYLNITEDGMVAATSNDDGSYPPNTESEDIGVLPVQSSCGVENEMKDEDYAPSDSSDKELGDSIAKAIPAVTAPVKRSIKHLMRHYDASIWLLAYIAIVTSWPLLGSVLSVVFRKKIRGGLLPASWFTR